MHAVPEKKKRTSRRDRLPGYRRFDGPPVHPWVKKYFFSSILFSISLPSFVLFPSSSSSTQEETLNLGRKKEDIASDVMDHMAESG